MDVLSKLKLVPELPGCYLWKNKDNQVIYVGKAKNLRKRMQSYFRNDNSPKTQMLVKNIASFDIETTPSEIDALLLEINLINKHDPKYNIKIKNSFLPSYIEINFDNQQVARVTKRFKKQKNSYFFGPFPDGYSGYKLTKILNEVFPFSKCLAPNSGKPCLNYELGQCLGQCFRKITQEEKDMYLAKAKAFLNGNTKEVEELIIQKIEKFSKIHNFESAIKFKEYLHTISNIKEKQNIVFTDSLNRDYASFFNDDNLISISISNIRFGNFIGTTNYLFEIKNEEPNNFFEKFIFEYYSKNIKPDVLYVHEESLMLSNVLECKVESAKTGKNYELLNNSQTHAKEKLLLDKKEFELKLARKKQSFDDLMKSIQLSKLNEIELMDISSFAGENQVGVVINYNNGDFDKNKYRKYIIETTDKQDDYQSMYEVAYRHFRNKLLNKENMPDLLIVDGKYQVKNVLKAISELKLNVKVIGVVKDDKHAASAIIDSELKIINLNKRTGLWELIYLLQEEVHRFAISFARNKKSKELFTSSLDEFKFLTEEDKNNLFNTFKTARQIYIAKESDLSKVISPNKAKKLIIQLNNK